MASLKYLKMKYPPKICFTVSRLVIHRNFVNRLFSRYISLWCKILSTHAHIRFAYTIFFSGHRKSCIMQQSSNFPDVVHFFLSFASLFFRSFLSNICCWQCVFIRAYVVVARQKFAFILKCSLSTSICE